MVTREQLEYALETRKAFTIAKDHHVVVITLLRDRIPYEECRRIISGAEHDVLYLCDVDTALPYLTIEDVEILAECNLGIEEDRFRLFV